MRLLDQLIAYCDRQRQSKPVLEALRSHVQRLDESLDQARTTDPTITIRAARALIECLQRESVVIAASTGIGITQMVFDIARARGMRCQSLLGAQLAPHDLPRRLRLQDDRPVCLLLDELTSAAPDVQAAMWSLLLERQIGDRTLPVGSWVIAACGRTSECAQLDALDPSLVNRVFVIRVRPSVDEWLEWAERQGVRTEIRCYIRFRPAALVRASSTDGQPFSTPRAWAALSRALDAAEHAGLLDASMRRTLASGRVSAADADGLCAAVAFGAAPPLEYVSGGVSLPNDPALRWFLLDAIREVVDQLGELERASACLFLRSLSPEERAFVLIDHVETWGRLVGPDALLEVVHAFNQITVDAVREN